MDLAPLVRYLSGLTSLFFPVICKGCGKILESSRTVICGRCEMELPRTNFLKLNDNPVAQMFWGRIKLEYAASLFYYRKAELLQKLIHHLKYQGGKETGLYLGRIAGKMLKQTEMGSKINAIVPIPLHYRKQRIRGFNQTELIAQGIQEILFIPVINNAVVRAIFNESQTRRGRHERWQNVKGIFKMIDSVSLRHKHILVLDDVVTTGATIEAFCQTVQNVPGIKLSVLTIGYAVR